MDWNDGYYLEGADRVHTLQVMIEELLDNHPSIKRLQLDKDLEEVRKILGGMYLMLAVNIKKEE